jgi:hypothetical protein
MILISRPIHKRYALHSISDESYITFVNGYSLAKKTGIRSVWLFVSGSGVYGLCQEVLKKEVQRWGRRKLGSGVVASLCWIGTPIVPLITNSSKIIRIANVTHTAIAFVAETCEDCTNLAWLPIDLALTGQPISVGESGRFNLMGGDDSLFNFFND